MDLRHPVRSLSWALTRALERDLDAVDSKLATGMFHTQTGKAVGMRPAERDCNVVMFSQTWTAQALGYTEDEAEGTHHVEAETIVITGPGGDACVYVATQLLYHVQCPNRRFFLDVAAQQMRGRADRGGYEGRDTADEEAFDFEVAGALARVRGAAQRLSPADAERVVRRLTECAAELAAVVGS
jgi:hypothetical protein